MQRKCHDMPNYELDTDTRNRGRLLNTDDVPLINPKAYYLKQRKIKLNNLRSFETAQTVLENS